jgi:predicted dehydrogenase
MGHDNDPPLPEALHIVLVGFGHAGRIHLKAYEACSERGAVTAIVEHNPERAAQAESLCPGIAVFRSLGAALEQQHGTDVIDFCVPAKANLELVRSALDYGVRKFLIEKPLGWDVDSTNQLVTMLEDCEVVYLDTYVASAGVRRVLEQIRELGARPQRVSVVFHKNRVADSRVSRGFDDDAVPNAWMIEGPHMLSIAQQVAGEISRIAEASTFDMGLEDDRVLPDHGGGHALLEHRNGAFTSLDLSLCSDRNERFTDVELENGARLHAALPTSKSPNQCSRLVTVYPSGRRDEAVVGDRPLEACVQNAIRYLAGDPVRVSRLADGLAFCSLIEQMTEKKQFWQAVPKQWKHFGPPLRPCRQDIEIMESAVARWMAATGADGCNALLCGVTPEIASMAWPDSTRLWAVEKSRAMIDEVWPEISEGKQALQADWRTLPFQDDSFDIVIGDGCFTSLAYPRVQAQFLDVLRRVLRPDGWLIMRFFVQQERPESPAAVFGDLDRIGSFHVLKWRLAMALQKSARDGVVVNDIWEAWRTAGVTTPWPPAAVGTIDTYRGSNHVLTFTSLEQIRALMSPSFREISYTEPSYELGDRCPILVYSQQ